MPPRQKIEKGREPRGRYSYETIRSGIVMSRNCYVAELLWTRSKNAKRPMRPFRSSSSSTAKRPMRPWYKILCTSHTRVESRESRLPSVFVWREGTGRMKSSHRVAESCSVANANFPQHCSCGFASRSQTGGAACTLPSNQHTSSRGSHGTCQRRRLSQETPLPTTGGRHRQFPG